MKLSNCTSQARLFETSITSNGSFLAVAKSRTRRDTYSRHVAKTKTNWRTLMKFKAREVGLQRAMHWYEVLDGMWGYILSTYCVRGRTRAITRRPVDGFSTARIRRRRVSGAAHRSRRLRQATTSYCACTSGPSVPAEFLSHSSTSSTLQRVLNQSDREKYTLGPKCNF